MIIYIYFIKDTIELWFQYFLREFVKALLKGGRLWLASLIGGSSFLAYLAYIGYYKYNEWELREYPIRVFEHGHIDIPKERKQEGLYKIPRHEELARFADCLDNAGVKYYVVVTGEHGTGKSTLVQDLCKSKLAGHVLVAVSQMDEVSGQELLGASLRKVFCANPAPAINILAVIDQAAKAYCERHGSQPTLIIDNINMATNMAEVFALQNAAKMWADERVLTVVFVTSDGHVVQALQARSVWSRAAEYQIGGVPEPEAVDYLVKHNFTINDAQRVVRELTGDRLYLLNAVSMMSMAKGFEGIRTSVIASQIRHFYALISKDNRGTLGIAEAILKSPTKSISISKFNAILGLQDPAFLVRSTLLLSNQVFALKGDQVMFQSRAMQACAERELPLISATSSWFKFK